MKLFIAAAIAIAVLVELIIHLRSRRKPRTSADHLRVGDRALGRGDLDAACEHYREAIRVDHSNAEAHYGLATTAMHRGDFDAAIEHLIQARQYVDDVYEVHHALGAAHYHKGDMEGALEHYQRAVEVNPDGYDSRSALADVYHALGRTEEAEEVCPGYTPLPPEDVARREMIGAQLGPGGWERLHRWDSVEGLLTGIQLLAGGACLAWLAVEAATALYNRVAGTGKLESAIPDSARLVLVLSIFGSMGLIAVALRAMDAHRRGFLRRLLTQSNVAREEIDAVFPMGVGPPWWRVELSGFHLVVWLSLLASAIKIASGQRWSDWADVIFLYAAIGGFLKAGFWMALVQVEPERRAAWGRAYRWFGTLRGTVFMLLVIPAVLVGVPLLFWGVNPLTDW